MNEPALSDDASAQARRSRLVEGLVEGEHVLDPAWVHTFRVVPRRIFIPAMFVPVGSGYRSLRAEADRDVWLETVYSDEPVVTQIDGRLNADAVSHGTLVQGGEATCSSSQPSLMAIMLRHLDVHPGMRVLEIGTGTGYHTALVAERLSASQVSSIEFDPHLARSAARRLEKLGYPVSVITGDGANPEVVGSYDRLIATCSFPRVPHAWLSRVRPGGLVLLNLQRPLAVGLLAVVRVHDAHSATGTLAPDFAGFMPTRWNHQRDLIDLYQTAVRGALPGGEATLRVTSVPAAVLEDDGFLVMASLVVAARMLTTQAEGGPVETWLLADDESFARVWQGSQGETLVSEGGPQHLWTEVEQVHQLWNSLGCPTRDNFHLSITDDAQRVGVGPWLKALGL